jgi:hypothetical protein
LCQLRFPAILSPGLERVIVSAVIVYAVGDDALSLDFPLGDAVETFIRQEDAERFIEECGATSPTLRPTCESSSASSWRAGWTSGTGTTIRTWIRRSASTKT